MLRLIARGLRGVQTRTTICAAGIAVSTLLVLVLFGAYRSVVGGVASYLRRPGMDLWIAPRGTDNLIRSSGFLAAETLDELRAVDGVLRVDPIVRTFVTGGAGQERVTLLAIGFAAPDGLGGPPLREGRAPRGEDEIALDRAAAHRLHAAVGGVVVLSGQRKRVVGISEGTNLLATQFAFANVTGTPAVSFALAATVPASGVEDRVLKRFPDLEVMNRASFEANNVREIGAGFVPMLRLITSLGIASASLLVAFLIHGIFEERRGELAVLLAAGATPAAIGSGIAFRAAEVLATGIAMGVASAHLLAWTIDRVAPVMPLALTTHDLLLVAALLSISGIAASVLPIIHLKDIDPLEAFR